MPHLQTLRNLLAGVLAIAAMLFMAPGGAQNVGAVANCDVANATFDEAEHAFLDVINNYRTTNGLQPLTVSANLNRAAEWMAIDLVRRPFLSHLDSFGRDSQQRIAECGGTPWFGENLAAGTRMSSAQAVFSLLRSSGGHNRNMLHADYKQIGIARYYAPGSRYTWYWVTTFSVAYDGTGTLPGDGLVLPPPGTKLPGTTAAFEWTDMGADEYWLTVGTTPGGYDLYSASLGLALTATVTNLPSQGGTIYVRQWSRHGGLWSYTDYSYTATYQAASIRQ